MAELPLVSIVIPAYNAAAFLRETLDSVFQQTYDSIEVVLVDDGSTDSTAEVVREYGSGAVRYLSQENQGVSVARNRGLKEVRGEYVCFLDADDWLFPENIRLKVDLLERNPDLALASSWVSVTDPELKPTGLVLKGGEGRILGDLLDYIPPAIPCPSNALIRTEIVREVGGFDERLSTAADFDLWLRLAARHEIGRVDEVLVKYRRHGSAMFNDIEAQVRDMEWILEKHSEELSAHDGWRVLQWRFYRSVAGGFFRERKPGQGLRYLLKGLFARGLNGPG
ncbi:glycosyltransferase [Gemmatimonadota bacterium]